jgi:hypothetical protein
MTEIGTKTTAHFHADTPKTLQYLCSWAPVCYWVYGGYLAGAWTTKFVARSAKSVTLVVVDQSDRHNIKSMELHGS